MSVLTNEIEEEIKTANGKDVITNNPDFLDHMKAHPDIDPEHIKEAIEKTDYKGPFAMIEVNLGRDIGTSDLVKLDEWSQTLELPRKGREGLTNIILNAGEDQNKTEVITIGICDDRDNEGKPTMFTAFYGERGTKEPWDKFNTPEEQKQAEEYWNTHALIYKPENIDFNKVTAEQANEISCYVNNEDLNKTIQILNNEYKNEDIKEIKEIFEQAVRENNLSKENEHLNH